MTLVTALISGLLITIVLAAAAITTVGIDELLRETPEDN